MQVIPYTRSEDGVKIAYGIETTEFINQVISAINRIDCKLYFEKHNKQLSSAQKINIKKFQDELKHELNPIDNPEFWRSELCPPGSHDRFDFYCRIILDGYEYEVIIELDKGRADQISKKFVSRTFHTLGKPSIYFAFCYPGTKSMSVNECTKYLGYCQNITLALNEKNIPKFFIGLITESKKKSKRSTKGSPVQVTTL